MPALRNRQLRKFRCTTCNLKRRKCEFNTADGSCTECNKLSLKCDFLEKNSLPSAGSPKKALHADMLLPPRNPFAAHSAAEYRWTDLCSDESEHRLKLGFDIGTKFSSAVFQIVHKNSDLSPDRIIDSSNVQIEGRHQIPTEAAIVREHDHITMLFGFEVDKALRRGRIKERDVLRNLKLCLIPENEPRFGGDASLLKSVHQLHQNALHHAASRRPRIFDIWTNKVVTVKIDSIHDVFIEFLRYLWNNVKLNLQQISDLKKEEIDNVLDNNSNIAIAVPAIWTDSMIDEFIDLIHAAGLPKLHVRSEPKCAAAVVAQESQRQINESITLSERRRHWEEQRKIVRVVVDIGGGTVDLTTCCVQEIKPRLKISTWFRGSGSLWGSMRINEIFKDKVRQIFGFQFKEIVKKLKNDSNANMSSMSDIEVEGELLESLAKGFEEVKSSFNGRIDRDYEIIHGPKGYNLPEIRNLPIRPLHISMPAKMVRAIFDEYLSHLYPLIEDQLDKIFSAEEAGRRELPKSWKIQVLAVGGGSLSPYIISKLQNKFTDASRGVTVSAGEKTNFSLVARGAFLSTIDPELGRREFARCSYGIDLCVPYDPSNKQHLRKDARPADYYPYGLEVRDRIEWLILMSQNIAVPPKPMVIQGHINVKEEDLKWPIELEQKIWRCEDETRAMSDGWKVHEEDSIVLDRKLTIFLYENECQFELLYDKQQGNYLQIEFRAVASWDGLSMSWQFIVPWTGSFPNDDLTDHGPDPLIKEGQIGGVLRHEDMELRNEIEEKEV